MQPPGLQSEEFIKIMSVLNESSENVRDRRAAREQPGALCNFYINLKLPS
jgi:hypothetical protein